MIQDPYKYFRVEARELLDQLGKGMLDIEKGAGGPELPARMLRLAHTLKGAARVVRQREIADSAHAIEDALTPFRNDSTTVPTRGLVDTVLKLLDGIDERVRALSNPVPATDMARSKGEPPQAKSAATRESFGVGRESAAEMDTLIENIAETHALVKTVGRGLDAVTRAHRLADVLAGQLAGPRGREAARVESGADMEKARSLAAELRVLLSGLDRNLVSGVERVERELLQVRGLAEELRLVPAETLFTSLERVARDTAQALGKQVAFEGVGGGRRVSGAVLGIVQGALIQMVRNAIAHGLETPAARRAANKSDFGRVTIEVIRRGRRIVFRCSDDGRGVDLDAVRRAAQERGVPGVEAAGLDAAALLRLLLRGGISTSGSVTEVAGRGIGLDIVSEAAGRLGGEAAVETEAGKGTRIELSVPLSLASLEVLLTEADGARVALPLDAVSVALRVGPDEVARTADGNALLHDGKTVPFIALADLLGGANGRRAGKPWTVVLVNGKEGRVAFGVDRLRGTANVVLRQLPELAPPATFVAGAVLEADGAPRLVLDPDGLVARALQAGAGAATSTPEHPIILVVDDSLTTRMLEQSILESVGYRVELASSGEEGLSAMRDKRPALVLCDIEMPGIDGFTFVERVRADPALHDIPIILVTSRAAREDRRRGEAVGAQGYIVKSEFDQANFIERIRRLAG